MMEEEVGRLLFRGFEDHHIRFDEDAIERVEGEFQRLWGESHEQRAGNRFGYLQYLAALAR